MPIQTASIQDLPAINQVIEQAVMGWSLPERVKRLSLPSYRYSKHDMAHLHIVMARDGQGEVMGVAAWEHAAASDLPIGKRGLLLHGLYVAPAAQRKGIGSQLLAAANEAARTAGLDGVLVKAQSDALGFFQAKKLEHLPTHDTDRDYPHRYWLDRSSAV